MQALPVEPEGRAEHPVAEPRRAPDDRVEHRLRVSRRTGDDPEDLRRRRLLLQRFGQVLVPALQLLEEPHILDRDDGLVGEGPHQLDLFIAEGLDLRPPDRDDSDDGGFPEHRDGEDCADLFAALTRSPTVFGVRQDVRDVNDPAFEDGSPDRGLPTRQVGVPLHDLNELRGRPVGSRLPIEFAVRSEDGALVGAAEPHRAFDERFQHGLEIERRAADDLQDLARRGLLFQRLGQLAIAGLEFLEQPHVLDGDDRLIGEGLQERDLSGRERLDDIPADHDGSERCSFPQERHHEGRAGVVTPCTADAHSRLRVLGLRQGLEIVDVKRPTLAHGPSSHAGGRGGDAGADRYRCVLMRAVKGHDVKALVI
jgi:hypothetical protein